jgi:hypothetical protein
MKGDGHIWMRETLFLDGKNMTWNSPKKYGHSQRGECLQKFPLGWQGPRIPVSKKILSESFTLLSSCTVLP